MDYEKLLDKALEELPEEVQEKGRFEVPKVVGHIQGNHTVITNFFKIGKALDRDPEHILKYILKELAAPGKLVGQRLVLGAKIPASRINEKIKKYCQIYVICSACGKPETKIVKEKGGMTSLVCQACGSRHPVRLL